MDGEDDEEDISESGINPPAYTPPEAPDTQLLPPEKVIVTQPTPVGENSSGAVPTTTNSSTTPKPTTATTTASSNEFIFMFKLKYF